MSVQSTKGQDALHIIQLMFEHLPLQSCLHFFSFKNSDKQLFLTHLEKQRSDESKRVAVNLEKSQVRLWRLRGGIFLDLAKAIENRIVDLTQTKVFLKTAEISSAYKAIQDEYADFSNGVISMNQVLRQESSAFGKSNATLLLNILSYLEPKNPSFSLCLKEFKEKPVGDTCFYCFSRF